MRPSLIAACLLAAMVLVGCQMQGREGTALATDEISVTTLDAPAASAAAGEDGTVTEGEGPPRPEPRPDTVGEPAEAEAETPEAETPDEPQAPKPPEQLQCEKTGGQWAVAGQSGAYVCVTPTRDGGKICRKKTNCEGLCLARSGTCAPITPLIGCNEVLEKDGRRVTLCID